MQRSRQVTEWREEGLVEGKRRSVLRVLQARFGSPIPADLAAAVAELNDSDELAGWLDAAATAASLEAFRTAVGS